MEELEDLLGDDYILQFTSVATWRLEFISDGILSDGILSVTSLSSSNMNWANNVGRKYIFQLTIN